MQRKRKRHAFLSSHITLTPPNLTTPLTHKPDHLIPQLIASPSSLLRQYPVLRTIKSAVLWPKYAAQPGWESVGLGSHRRILIAIALDFGLAGAAVVFGDGVHYARDMLAATPPGHLVCCESVWKAQSI